MRNYTWVARFHNFIALPSPTRRQVCRVCCTHACRAQGEENFPKEKTKALVFRRTRHLRYWEAEFFLNGEKLNLLVSLLTLVMLFSMY